MDRNNKAQDVKKIPGIILAESDDKAWEGMKAVSVDWQPVNRKPFLIEKKTGIVLGYRFEGAIKSTYKLGDDKWRRQDCVKDDFMIVRAHEETKWSWQNMSAEEDSLLTMIINIEQSLIDSITSQVGIDHTRVEFHHLANQRDPYVTHIFKRLLLELNTMDPLSKLSVDTLKSELIIHLLRNYTVLAHKVEESTKGLSEAQIATVNDYIQAYYYNDITLKELANLVNLSEYHFSRLYKQSTGVTPYQYILQWRFKKAQELLSFTTLTVQQVAFQVGYKDASSFSKAFSKYFGLTPGLYRKQVS
jgi:AraC family transcriptional regulator